jgi:hypothetical protein
MSKLYPNSQLHLHLRFLDTELEKDGNPKQLQISMVEVHIQK